MAERTFKRRIQKYRWLLDVCGNKNYRNIAGCRMHIQGVHINILLNDWYILKRRILEYCWLLGAFLRGRNQVRTSEWLHLRLFVKYSHRKWCINKYVFIYCTVKDYNVRSITVVIFSTRLIIAAAFALVNLFWVQHRSILAFIKLLIWKHIFCEVSGDGWHPKPFWCPASPQSRHKPF